MEVKRYKALALLMIVVFCMSIIACSSPEIAGTSAINTGDGQLLKVHFIDVGQADAILIQGPMAENVLIDAGNNADSELVVNYIKKQGIEKLRAVVGTHPHEDHIGGLDAVIRSFEVEKVYMPKVAHTSETFKDVLDAVADKGLKVTTAVKGVSIPVSGMSAEFMGPVGAEYDELNNYSAVLKITYGDTSFLFQGDAEAESEKDMLGSDIKNKLESDVVKLGHHGSTTSTTPEYLDVVRPEYAVISVGKENDYGHPHRETLELLKSKGIAVYRTDESGTIIAESNGKSIKFNTNPTSHGENPKASSEVKSYVDSAGNGLIKGNINSSGEKIYHLPGGAYYDNTKAEKWFKTEAEAQTAGFRPSKR